jgi:hypothetical protein
LFASETITSSDGLAFTLESRIAEERSFVERGFTSGSWALLIRLTMVVPPFLGWQTVEPQLIESSQYRLLKFCFDHQAYRIETLTFYGPHRISQILSRAEKIMDID